ncbi:alanine racemase [Elusimicrobium posterum]|uniref:alanine racemase n=1 Tax=Elusimicrobium posterum TaxID=3116653 RepID=UPI003C78942F
MNKILRPTWAEINLNNLEHNLKYVQELSGHDTKVLFVVKANAYGHGSVGVARAAQEKKLCVMFGTASVEEGITLRENGITLPILVLGSLYPFEVFEEAVKHDLSLTIASVDAAKAVVNVAEKLGKDVYCHVKQDTGMGRIGSRRTGVMSILEILSKNKNIIIEGLYTHLSSPETDDNFTMQQLEFFESAALEAKTKNYDIKNFHTCATYGTLLAPRGRFDLIRTGIGAYGVVNGDKNFKPVLSLKSKVVFIKDVKKGFSVSYDRTFVAEKDMRVATLPIGYGDGYVRAASNKGHVLINGKKCKITGRVTMDMFMVDITDAGDVKTGAEAVLIGRQGAEEITAADLAKWTGTIPYETLTLITARVPRIFIETK